MVIRKKTDANKGGALQMGFFMPESDWRPTPIVDLPSWAGAKRIAIDCETKDSQLRELGPGPRRDGYTTGWSFAIEGGPKYYLPIRHEGGDNLDEQGALGYLREQIKGFKGEFVGANLSYDMDYGYNDGFEWNPEVKFRDIQIADPLIYELHYSYSLAKISERNGVGGKDESLLMEAARAYGLDPKRGMWRLPARFVGEYAEQDAVSPLENYAYQRKVLDQNDLWRVFDLETDVLPVLVRMRRRGVRIDQDKLLQIEEQSELEEREALDLVKKVTGCTINVGDVWKPGALAPALEEIGLKLERTSTGQPKIDKELLSGTDHPVAAAILSARKVNKIRTTFAASIRRFMVDGRIHCTYNQIAMVDEIGEQKGVRYGRVSAVNPNLQQQPSRYDPEVDSLIIKEWRKIFIPEEGALWGCNDYSQQEPRWTTHFAALKGLPGAKDAANRYIDDPETDNHEMMTRIIHGDKTVEDWMESEFKKYKMERGLAKAIYLGLCYGEGGAKLCQDIHKPTRWMLQRGWGRNKVYEYFESKHDAWVARADAGQGYVREVAGEEGQEIIDKFDAEVPFVRMAAKAAGERANDVGFVKTILGRRLHFKQNDDSSYYQTHKALNRIIQGSAADQTKYALVELDKAGSYIQLQVHDEMDGSYGSVEEAVRDGDIMRDSVKEFCNPLLPFKVDTETGPNWGDIS